MRVFPIELWFIAYHIFNYIDFLTYTCYTCTHMSASLPKMLHPGSFWFDLLNSPNLFYVIDYTYNKIHYRNKI